MRIQRFFPQAFTCETSLVSYCTHHQASASIKHTHNINIVTVSDLTDRPSPSTTDEPSSSSSTSEVDPKTKSNQVVHSSRDPLCVSIYQSSPRLSSVRAGRRASPSRLHPPPTLESEPDLDHPLPKPSSCPLTLQQSHWASSGVVPWVAALSKSSPRNNPTSNNSRAKTLS